LTLERELITRRLTGSKPRSQVWKAAKNQLKSESGGKCAYCEGKAAHVAHGDVEHYRPKDVYWWLAYCYDNYVYACQICNQSYKGVNFPLQGAALPAPPLPQNPSPAQTAALAGTLAPDPQDAVAVQSFLAAARMEDPSIPDPYTMDTEQLFAWQADHVLGEVEILPRGGSPSAVAAHNAAVTFLGLNRYELKRWRYETYEAAELLVATLKSGQLDAALTRRVEARLRAMMSVNGEFAAMVRFLVRDIEQLAL
jgi:hypothetical protein